MSERSQAYLKILTGDLRGGVFVLSELSVFEIGRGESCHVRLQDELVAWNHARVLRRDGGWGFLNLSESGSFVNDIPTDTRPLDGNEIIRVGGTELQFTFTPPGRRPASEEHSEAGGTGAPAADSVSRDARFGGDGCGAQSPREAESVPPPAPVDVLDGPSLEHEIAAQRPPAPPAAASLPSVHAPFRTRGGSLIEPQGSGRVPERGSAREGEPDRGRTRVDLPGAGLLSAAPRNGDAPTADGCITELDLPALPAQREVLRLVVIDGSEADLGRELLFIEEGETRSIGRSVGSDFVLMDGKVSRTHCTVRCSAGRLFVEDLGSSNGTVVNGEKVHKTVLEAGDYVRLGFTVLGCERAAIALGDDAVPETRPGA